MGRLDTLGRRFVKDTKQAKTRVNDENYYEKQC